MWKAIEDAPMEVLVSEMKLTWREKKVRPMIDCIGYYDGRIIILARDEWTRTAQWWCELDPLPNQINAGAVNELD